MSIEIKNAEQQALDYFVKQAKALNERKFHSDPRQETDWYWSEKFNEEKAKALFFELKEFFNKNKIWQ